MPSITHDADWPRVSRELPSPESLVDARTSPVVDPRGATFLYRGKADAVRLRCWIRGLPGSLPFERLADTDTWALRLELPTASRLEYKLEIEANGHAEWMLDPLNQDTAADPFGANSVCKAYGYVRPTWSLPDPAAPVGAIDELPIESDAFGDTRRVGIYLPARFDRSKSHPLLVVHDGFDYLNYASLQVVLDNLIDRGDVAPLVAVLTQARDRTREYAANDAHATFVTAEIPAALERRLGLKAASSCLLMGASFGAVAALHAAWSHPGAWHGLVLQSGSFATAVGRHDWEPAAFEAISGFVRRFRAATERAAQRIYVSCGVYESLIEENRELVPLLDRHGLDVRYEESRDGHHWENWRDRLKNALAWVCPGRPGSPPAATGARPAATAFPDGGNLRT
jgi:enterochelin esterase family protein